MNMTPSENQDPGLTRPIKAIETVYKGYRFRSRLEARWAVFFDALGIEWEYEKEGYDLGDAGWYLPDFWLPGLECFSEVKPSALTEEETQKCLLLSLLSPVVAVIGIPGEHVPRIWGNKGGGPVAMFSTCRHCLATSIIDVFAALSEERKFMDERHLLGCGCIERGDYDYELPGDHLRPGARRLKAAEVAARSARFEHGERPQ
jgi:hypothetical protein